MLRLNSSLKDKVERKKVKELQLIKKRLAKLPSSPQTQVWPVMHADHKWKHPNEHL